MPAPIYKDQGHSPFQEEFDKLWVLCMQLRECVPSELSNQLEAAFTDLQAATRANLPITKTGMRIGYGINKANKAIACDTAIAIIRQIKALKAW